VSPHLTFGVLIVKVEDNWSRSNMILGVDKVNDRGNLCETTKLYKLKEVTFPCVAMMQSNHY